MNLLIPSPVEMILRGKALSIHVDLSTVQGLLKHEYNNSKKVLNSLYLGRTFAVVSLGMTNLDDLTLGKYFLRIKDGMMALDTPQAYLDIFEGIRFQFESRTISRADLIEKIDMGFTTLASRLEEDQSRNLLNRVLQGSAWIQAQNLLAKALKKRNEYQYAKALLDQPTIVDFIIDNLMTAKKKEKSVSDLDYLLKSIKIYKAATKPDHLGPKEVGIVIEETEKFLTRF